MHIGWLESRRVAEVAGSRTACLVWQAAARPPKRGAAYASAPLEAALKRLPHEEGEEEEAVERAAAAGTELCKRFTRWENSKVFFSLLAPPTFHFAVTLYKLWSRTFVWAPRTPKTQVTVGLRERDRDTEEARERKRHSLATSPLCDSCQRHQARKKQAKFVSEAKQSSEDYTGKCSAGLWPSGRTFATIHFASQKQLIIFSLFGRSWETQTEFIETIAIQIRNVREITLYCYKYIKL